MRWFKETYRSCMNLVVFFKVIWNYRWYDYGYTLDIIVKDLEVRERQWGVHTHYVGDAFTKKRVQVLLRMYKRYVDGVSIYDEDKYLRMFLRMYSKTLPRLWD